MAATLSTIPTELPPQTIDRSTMLPWHFPAPALTRLLDAAHEHWPKDEICTKHHQRAGDEYCPPEVYVG